MALLTNGHRRIGLINDVQPVPAMIGRQAGYQQALAEYGVAFDETLVTRQSSDPPGGHKGLKALMTNPEPPTAVFCFNDRMAMGVYRGAREMGLRIPADLSVVGFDNQELIAPYLDPPLTTMELPHYEMGQWAMAHLLELIQNPAAQSEPHPVQHLCECPLIERASIKFVG
ncbi:MAG: substrate-binding domain-containing protein [Caldilineaceae bacterium]